MKKLLTFIVMISAALAMQAQTIVFPFGAADYQSPTSALSCTLSITNNVTYVAPTTLDTNITFVGDFDEVRRGALLYVNITADESDRTVAWHSSYFTVPTCTVNAGTNQLFTLLYNGTKFELIARSAPAESTVYWPNGPVDKQSHTPALVDTVAINNSNTYITYNTLDTNLTLHFTVDSDVRTGAIVYVELVNDATEHTLAHNSANITSGNITLTASKRYVITYLYNGSKFICISTRQVD